MNNKNNILPAILDQKINTDKSNSNLLLQQTKWFSLILHWVQRPRSKDEKIEKADTLYTTRIKYLLQLLKSKQQWQDSFVTQVKSILIEMTSPAQLATAGLSKNKSFQQDLLNRLQDKILPSLPPSFGLEDLIVEIFPDDNESVLVDSISPEILTELIDLFKADADFTNKIRNNIVAAAHTLSLEYLTLTLQMLGQTGQQTIQLIQLCEFQLEDSLRAMVLAHSSPKNQIENIFSICQQIEKHLIKLEEKMKQSAVKVDWVYDFKIQRRRLDRIFSLIQFLSDRDQQSIQVRFFIARLIIDCHHQKSLRSFLVENFTLMTQKVVQSNSHHGEHYVTYNWQEFKAMFKSASGAGAITSLTVFAKNLIAFTRLDGFLKGIGDSFNYSFSFLIIQLLGYTLATKQPSGTAPFIAQVLKKSVSVSRQSIIALLRTQFIAVLGNLLLVFPISFLISWLMSYMGYSFFTESEALYAFKSSNVVSFNPLFAGLTGVILFLGGIIAGWFENFCLVNQMEQRIKNSKSFIRFLGSQRTDRLASFVHHNSNALAANFSLGFLLGMTPQFLQFLSIPFEVKHVTLSTGQFAASLPVILSSQAVTSADYVNATLGLAVIGIMNISVSFLLAFMMASISSEVNLKLFFRHLGWGIKLVLTRPWLLFLPQSTSANKKGAE